MLGGVLSVEICQKNLKLQEHFVEELLPLLMQHVWQDEVLVVADLDLQFKITISNPQKVERGSLAGVYFCEVYLPDIAQSNPIYADTPDEAVKNADIFIKVYLKEKIINIESLFKRNLTKELEWAKRELEERQKNIK